MTDIPPIFRTETQRRLLAELLFDDSPEPRTLTDLARRVGVEQTTVMREANRLIEAGLLTEHRIGRARMIEIDEDSPFVAPLRQIFRAADPRRESGARARNRHAQRSERTRHERRPLPSAQRP